MSVWGQVLSVFPEHEMPYPDLHLEFLSECIVGPWLQWLMTWFIELDSEQHYFCEPEFADPRSREILKEQSLCYRLSFLGSRFWDRNWPVRSLVRWVLIGQHLWKGRKQDWTKQEAQRNAFPIKVLVSDSSELYWVVNRGQTFIYTPYLLVFG